MKLGTNAIADIAPIPAPQIVPRKRVNKTETPIENPELSKKATNIPHRAVMLPTDKSIFAVRMTNVIPIATKPVIEACWKRLEILVVVKKFSESAEAIKTTIRKIKTKLYLTTKSTIRFIIIASPI